MTPDTLTSLCAAQSGSSCAVLLEGRYTLALTSDWHLPATMHLHFAQGSSLAVTGGVLHFDDASVEAPPDTSLFPDPERIRDLSAARPEWFAQGQPAGPVSASVLAEAYEATVPWGTIYLQNRQYVSPFHACPGSALRFDSPRTLVGAARPVPDDPAAPTHLQDGTTLLGGITGTAPLRLAHLGIDAGPQVAAQVLHGCEPPGIFIEQPGRTFVSGDRLEDVSILTTGLPNMHSVMFAGHRDTQIKDLWIWTLGGTHGLVMKSENSMVDGLHCWGALYDCLIVKSDYATSFLGRAVHDRISHVDIHPLRPGGYVGGIVVESRWDTVRDLEMDDIHQSGSRFAIVLLGSTFYRPRGITIRHWTADDVTGTCLFSDKANDTTISDFQCSLLPLAQAGAVLLHSRNISLRRGTVRCTGLAAQCNSAAIDGVLNASNGTSLDHFVAQDLSGYVVRSSGPSASLSATEAPGMDGRIVISYRVPYSVRWHDACLQIKPNLRILYTAVTSRVFSRPRTYVACGLIFLLAAASAGLGWRLKRSRPRHFGRV